MSGVAFVMRMLFQRPLEVDGIAIHGPQPFRDAVAAAIRLLASDAPDAFTLCQDLVSTVVMSRHSGVMANRRPAVVLLGDWVTRVSLPYLASTIAHEVYHCKLYWLYRDDNARSRVPAHIYTGEAAERQCIEYQTAVLKQLGGTEDEVRKLGDHMATEFWKVPWHERTW